MVNASARSWEDSTMATESKLTSVGSLVPQVFFDLIGRVVPGTAAIGIVALGWFAGDAVRFAVGWLNRPPEHLPEFLIVLATLTASYTFASILWGICFTLGHMPGIKKVLFRGHRIATIHRAPEEIKKYDFIKRIDPVAGDRITKLRAESMGAAVLLTAGLVALTGDLIQFFPLPPDGGRLAVGAGLLLAIVGSFASWGFLATRAEIALDSNAELLGYPGTRLVGLPRHACRDRPR
jgi:hypothetical protein